MDDREVVRVVLENNQAQVELKNGSERQSMALEVDAKLVKRMSGRRTQFFYATRREDGTVRLDAYAPWQDW